MSHLTHSASSPPPPTPSQTAIRTRIINHMNADHVDSLLLYLRYFSNNPPPPPGTPDPELTDISLVGITISHYLSPTARSPAVSFIPFTPPMESLTEARKRLVAMAEEAMEKVGSAGGHGGPGVQTLKTVTPPGAVGLVVAFLVLHVLVLFFPPISSRITFPPSHPSSTTHGTLPTSWYTKYILLNQPHLISLIYKFRLEFWLLVFGIHLTEAAIMDRKLVGKRGVKRGSRVWWGWVGWAFLEGYGSFKRSEKVWKGEGKKKE